MGKLCTQPSLYNPRGPGFKRSLLSTRSVVPTAVAIPDTVTNSVNPLYKGKTVVVVGAGPAGATCAMYLAQQGFSVQVYERRPAPSQDSVDTGRAYIIILTPRGQSALDKLGVALPSDENHRTQGTVRHNMKGQVRVSVEAGNVTFSRSGLAQYLISEASARYPDLIKFHFEAGCVGVDMTANQAVFQVAGEPSPRRVPYDLLVGADGVVSSVRDALSSALPGFSVDINDSGREYKVYSNLRGDIEPPEFRGRPGSTLHLFTADDPFTTVTAHSNPDGSYTGTFSLKTGGFAGLTSPEDYEALLRSKFVGLPDAWLPEIAQQVAVVPASSGGKRIRCSTLSGPGVLLLGDAAHGVTPVFGQGANSALESCCVLGEVLQECKGDVTAVPQAFDNARRPDAHALYELDRMAYSFFRKKGPLDPDFLQLLAHVVLGTVLSKIVPFWYGKQPALMQLGGSTSYAWIMAAVRRDSQAAAVLGVLALLLLVLKAVRVL